MDSLEAKTIPSFLNQQKIITMTCIFALTTTGITVFFVNSHVFPNKDFSGSNAKLAL